MSHDKDNYAFQDPGFGKFVPGSGLPPNSQRDDSFSGYDRQVHQVWFTVEVPNKEDPNEKVEEGGYLELKFMANSQEPDFKFGKISREDITGKDSELYKVINSKVWIASGDEFEDKNPWRVGDHLYTNGDYDAHLTGTVCRAYNYGNFNLEYVGQDWENLYDFKSWYVMADGSKPPLPEANAKTGSKISNQMLVLREPYIRDLPLR